MKSSKTIASLSLDLDNKWSYLKTHGDPGWESFPSYLGILVPRDEDGPFSPQDVHRVRLMGAFDDAGIGLDLIAKGIAKGKGSVKDKAKAAGQAIKDPGAKDSEEAETPKQ